MSFCSCSPHQFLGTGPAKGLKNKGFLGSVPHRIRSHADMLRIVGYVPKWLSEFDDLSEAVK